MYCINYVIKQGDSLYRISRHFNVSLKSIMDANPLVNVYHLILGETICIPVCAPQKQYSNYTTYLIKDKDTLGKILYENNTNLTDLLELNGRDEILLLPGTTLKVPI